MISRRNVLSGLAASATAGCSARPGAPGALSVSDRAAAAGSRVAGTGRGDRHQPQRDRLRLPAGAPEQHPRRHPQGERRRRLCRPGVRRADARRPRRRDCCGAPIISAPGRCSGAQQAAFFLAASRPGPRTLLALDLEANENNPSNSMTARPGRGLRAGGGRGDGPAAGRLRASDLGQWRSAAGLRPQLRRPDHAGLDPRALRPVGRRLPRLARDPAGLGGERAGGSGSMPATRVRAAPPTARPASCRASATAIATCSTATRPRCASSGAASPEGRHQPVIRMTAYQPAIPTPNMEMHVSSVCSSKTVGSG